MKRNRAEVAPNFEVLPAAPAKAQRRRQDSAVHSAGTRARKAAAVSTEKPREARGEDESLASGVAEASPPLAAAVVAKEEEGSAGWDGAAELGGGNGWWWWWGCVEEEKLLGWFPFANEDFNYCEGSGGGELGDLLWEEADHDIWQLQHIHEIPNTTKQ
ncbi:unnamed protein product [Musa banksii]